MLITELGEILGIAGRAGDEMFGAPAASALTGDAAWRGGPPSARKAFVSSNVALRAADSHFRPEQEYDEQRRHVVAIVGRWPEAASTTSARPMHS